MKHGKSEILIAEQDDALRKKLKQALIHKGFAVIDSSNGIETLETFSRPSFSPSSIDLVIVGSIDKDSWKDLELATQVRSVTGKVPIIFIAKESSEELAIAALRAGINDYVKQPFSLKDLLSIVVRYLPDFLSAQSPQNATEPEASIVDGHRMIGQSLIMQEIRAAIGRIASTDSNVLVTGETGTGKELVAELIHKNSSRSQQRLTCINCAAIPDNLLESELFGHERGSFTGAYSSSEGKLQSGDGGTIFLDEIGDMSPYAQAKILRVIESREVQRIGGKKCIPVNVRFIAATNKDLEHAIADNTFRNDLYYRLNVAHVQLPRLQDRKEDIPLLCDHYIKHFNYRFRRQVDGLTEETLRSFLHYDWPGNVRELKNVLEVSVGNFRCVRNSGLNESCGSCPEISFRCRQISLSDLPEQFRRRLGGARSMPVDERSPLLSVLTSTNWNISKAAQKLHWSRMTIYRKLAKYHISRKDHRKLDTSRKV